MGLTQQLRSRLARRRRPAGSSPGDLDARALARRRPARRCLRGAFLVAVPALLALCGAAEEAPASRRVVPLWDPAAETSGWLRRTYNEAGDPETAAVATLAPAVPGSGDGRWVELPVALPGENEFVLPLKEPWSAWRTLSVEVVLPEELPSSSVLTFFTKDWDHLWRQVRIPASGVRGEKVAFDLPIAGQAAVARWESRGHRRPWHTLTPGQVREFGCKVGLETGATDTFSGRVHVTRVWLQDPVGDGWEPRIWQYSFAPQSPRVGEVCEFVVGLDAHFTDPFDPEQVLVESQVTTPGGTQDRVLAFYFEDFLFPDVVQGAPLVPCGAPVFKVRYTARAPGRHTVRTKVSVTGRTLELPDIDFDARPPRETYKGSVRVDPRDRRFFSYPDGEVFTGVGINVRSPYDTRYVHNVPYSEWRDQGLPLYRWLFPKYKSYGINLVEVWMCSWWLALEWINDRAGYHGVGYMNQYHAWMMDRIFQWAEENGIQVILVFNNHGKFGTTFDTEWKRSPFNVANGGFLNDCELFFSDARAKGAFKRFCDYTIARWAYSPYLFSWKLFTEIDLTGNSLSFYQNPVMAEWHREMGRYIREQDVYDHMITTHWMLSYRQMNLAVADLPELDFLTTDAYYTKGSSPDMIELVTGAADFAVKRGKPILITEFGGSPYGESMGNFIKQHHIGTWTGFFCGSALPPMFWWFPLVEEKDLYHEYTVFNTFVGGEDRRGMVATSRDFDEAGLHVCRIGHSTRALIWGYDATYYLADEENLTPRTVEGFTVPVSRLAAGDYEVEHWDCERGQVASRQRVSVAKRGDAVTLTIPPFSLDFAVKIVPVK